MRKLANVEMRKLANVEMRKLANVEISKLQKGGEMGVLKKYQHFIAN